VTAALLLASQAAVVSSARLDPAAALRGTWSCAFVGDQRSTLRYRASSDGRAIEGVETFRLGDGSDVSRWERMDRTGDTWTMVARRATGTTFRGTAAAWDAAWTFVGKAADGRPARIVFTREGSLLKRTVLYDRETCRRTS
jgi:hypothetical protein